MVAIKFEFKHKEDQNYLQLSEEINQAFEILREEEESIIEERVQDSNFIKNNDRIAFEKNGRLQGVYVSDNILNLSKRDLSEAEISLLSKGLKFVPTPRYVDQAALKTDLENFGRKLRLAWHFRNENSNFTANPFKSKSNFNPKNKDVAIEMYLSKLEQEILNINTKLKYHNVTLEERRAIDSLRNDTSISTWRC